MTGIETTPDGSTLTWNDKPYAFAFACEKDARSFIKFVADRTGLDPHHQSDETLDRLLAEWQDA